MGEEDKIVSVPLHSERWVLLGGVWLIYFAFGVVMAAMAPLVSPIMGDLELTPAGMGAILGAWPLIYIVMAIPCGAFVDRAGLRWSLFLAALIMALSGALRAVAFDHVTMFLAVAIFGIGGPLISIGAPKLIAQWFAGKERGLAMGIYITGPGLGSIFSLSLTNSLFMPLFSNNWRVVLILYAVIVLVAGFLWLAISTPAERGKAQSQLTGIRSQLIVFRDLLQLRSVQIVLLMSIGIFFYSHGLNNWLPEILRTSGMTLREAGYWAAVPTAAGTIGSLLIPRLAVPNRRVAILTALILCAMAAALLILFAWLPVLTFGLILQGLARGSLMTVTMLVLMEAPGVAARHMGAAGGLFFSAAEIGGVLGPLTIGILLDVTGSFDASLYLMAIVTLALLVLLALLYRQGGFSYHHESSKSIKSN